MSILCLIVLLSITTSLHDNTGLRGSILDPTEEKCLFDSLDDLINKGKKGGIDSPSLHDLFGKLKRASPRSGNKNFREVVDGVITPPPYLAGDKTNIITDCFYQIFEKFPQLREVFTSLEDEFPLVINGKFGSGGASEPPFFPPGGTGKARAPPIITITKEIFNEKLDAVIKDINPPAGNR